MTARRQWLITGILAVVLTVGCAPSAAAPAAKPAGAAPSGVAPAGGAAAPQAASKPATSDAMAKLIEGARQEGELLLMWGPDTNGGPEGARRLGEGFNQAYGLNLSVRYTPGAAMPQVASMVAQEFQGGRPASTDVFTGSEAHIPTLLSVGALEPVAWLDWAPNVKADFIAPENAAVQVVGRIPGITYSTARVTGSAVPKTMEDLLKPEYKGRMAGQAQAAGFDRLASSRMWGKQRATDFVTRYADQIVGLLRCGEGERVTTGEFDIFAMDCGSYDALGRMAGGAPIGHVIPADAAYVAYWYMGVPKTARHPNAAKLWINYVLSPEAQRILYETGFVDHPRLEGSRTGQAIRELEATGVKFTHFDVQSVLEEDADEVERLKAEYQRILAKR
jgi:ABC-type Fe3+ transport system substrate-binding protein